MGQELAKTQEQLERDSMWERAKHLAGPACELLPERWHGKPAQVFQLAIQAKELGIELMSACRLTYIIHGTPALLTTAIIGLVNDRAGLASEIMFEERGELMSADYAVRAYGISGRSGERIEGVWVGMDMAEAEGWTKRRGNKYGSPLRSQMLRYRAATFWARLYAPEVLMGMHTVQEVEEMPRYQNPIHISSTFDDLNAQMKGDTPTVEEKAEEADAPVGTEFPEKTGGPAEVLPWPDAEEGKTAKEPPDGD